MIPAIQTALVVLAIAFVLAIPFVLIRGPRRTDNAEPRPLTPERPSTPATDPAAGLQARIVELERTLAGERARYRALEETHALRVRLCESYARIIDGLRPGLLSRTEPTDRPPP